MSAVGTFFLVHGFSALLPPIPENETTYYEILEVSPSATTEDIRRAYKQKSLMLHPDKVAQRGGDKETAKIEYQRVQEAHGVLADERKRQTYDMLGKSPSRHQFLSGGLNPGGMYENLTKATFCNKTRLVFLVTLLMCLILLQPILVASKVNQVVEMKGILQYTKWTAILIPWWIMNGLVVVVSFLVLLMTKRVTVFISVLEHTCWFVGEFLLALRWDQSITQAYVILCIPIYMALLFRWIHKIIQLNEIRTALERMVTLDYIEENVLENGRRYQDLTDEERHDIHKHHVLVHVPPSAEQETDEEIKVQASPEYEHAVESYTGTMNSLIAGVLVCTTFVALVVAKVDGVITVSWWVIFVPVWVGFGFQLLGSMYTCCCMPIVGDEVIVGGYDNHDEQDAKDNEEEYKREVDPSFSDVEASIRMGQQSALKDSDIVDLESGKGGTKDNEKQPNTESDEKQDLPIDEKESESKSDEPPITELEANEDSPVDEKESESKSAELPTKESDKNEAESATKEETPTPEKGSKPQETEDGIGDDDEFHFDQDFFREWEEARQEAEASVMEAHAKAQANCCAVLWQFTLICLIVGKLQQDYQRPPDEPPGYNAFWVLFPIFLVFGCVFGACACFVYGAGENEGFDHLVERRMSTTKADEDGGDEEAPEPKEETAGDAAVASKDEQDESNQKQVATITEQVSEIHDLD